MSNESNKSFKSSSDKDSDDEHLVIKYKSPLKRKKGEEEDMSEYVIGEKFKKACLATKRLKEIRNAVPTNVRLAQLEHDIQTIRHERDGMQIEIVELNDELNAHKRKCEATQRTATNFFGQKFEAYVKRNMDVLEGYTVDHVVTLNKRLQEVEARLNKQWELSNAVVQQILDKETARTVALDSLMAQNKK